MRSKEELKPLCVTYRTICGFVCLFSFIALLGWIFYITLEGFSVLVAIVGAAILVALHVSATISLTAYAPVYYRFVHLSKEDDLDYPQENKELKP